MLIFLCVCLVSPTPCVCLTWYQSWYVHNQLKIVWAIFFCGLCKYAKILSIFATFRNQLLQHSEILCIIQKYFCEEQCSSLPFESLCILKSAVFSLLPAAFGFYYSLHYAFWKNSKFFSYNFYLLLFLHIGELLENIVYYYLKWVSEIFLSFYSQFYKFLQISVNVKFLQFLKISANSTNFCK